MLCFLTQSDFMCSFSYKCLAFLHIHSCISMKCWFNIVQTYRPILLASLPYTRQGKGLNHWTFLLFFLSNDHKRPFWIQSHCFPQHHYCSWRLWWPSYTLYEDKPNRMEVTSALTSCCFLLSLVPQLPDVALTRLLQSQGFVALQSISQSQKDGVNMFLLSRVFGWSLKQREVVAVGKTLGGRRGDLPAVPQVTLVAHHDAGHQGPHRVTAALLYPLGDALEGAEAGHVVHENDGMDAAVVVLHHALPETLLTCRVPDLQLARQKHILIWLDNIYRIRLVFLIDNKNNTEYHLSQIGSKCVKRRRRRQDKFMCRWLFHFNEVWVLKAA